MRRGPALSFGFILLLALSLGPKLVLTQNRQEPDTGRIADDIGKALRAKGFSLETGKVALSRVYFGRKGGCSIMAGWVKGRGYQVTRYGQIAERLGPVRYYYRGRETAQFPRMRPVLEDQALRALAAFGNPAASLPVLALADNGRCAAMLPDWSTLRLHYRATYLHR